MLNATRNLHRLEGVDLRRLAEQVPTPFYAYSAGAIRQRIAELEHALGGLDRLICYAAKANSNLAVLQIMQQAGLGADIVSGGELQRCLRAGIPAARIVFSGVGKTDAEISAALAAGIWKFNVESFDELHALERLAAAQGTIARAAVRLNPDVDAGTHRKISTGRAENKFGVALREARRWFGNARELKAVRLDGLHVHIGSQILSLDPFRLALRRVAEFWRELVAQGHEIDSIDVGGGLGVRYRGDQDSPIALGDYAAAIRELLADFHGRIVLEPGRLLVAQAGVLVTRVLRVKEGDSRRFLVLDAAMTELLRPSLYDAWHDIVPLHDGPRPLSCYDVVGPVCESGDTFARGREMPTCEAGDLVVIDGAGAYGASMASTYNSRPLRPEVLVDGGRFAVVRRAQTMDELTAGESLPQEWRST